MPSTQPQLSDLRARVRECLESWEKYTESGVRAKRGVNVGNFVVAYALASHTHRLAKAAELLIEHRLGSECLPIVRAMHEFAVSAQWVMQVRDATASFAATSLYEKRKTIAALPLLNTAEATPEAIRKALDEIDSEPLSPRIASHFKAICFDLAPEGAAAYVNYRLMSAYSHPSKYLVGLYMNFDELDAVPSPRDIPALPPLESWLTAILSSLMWAGQAIEFADPRHERRALLQAVETQLGIKRVLRPSAVAFLRD